MMRDYRDPSPYTEYNGRHCTATIEVTLYLKGDVTENQLAEWLDYEIGGGGISTSNPLVEGEAEADFRDVDISNLRIEDMWSYTDWNEADADGSRTGRTRFERTPPTAQGIEAGTDETAQPVRPEGREPGPKDAPTPSDPSSPRKA